MEEKVDFVITWVDGGDVEWQKERNKYAGKDPEDLADYRYRDWDNLKYWFRGVEKFAPWVNNVFFVTNGQKPDWLNLNHPKLKWIKHEDYIPKECLPTFNANSIELNFHRIKDLSEFFVYFNDDTFIVNTVFKDTFFKNDLPRLFAELDVNNNDDELFAHIVLNDACLINRQFRLKEVMKNNRTKWFDKSHSFKDKFRNYYLSKFNNVSAIKVLHMHAPMLKSTYSTLWKDFSEEFMKTSKNRFRSRNDYNQYVFSWFNIMKGNFEPFNPKIVKYYSIGKDDTKIVNDISRGKYKLVCLNDTIETTNFENSKKTINDCLNELLPEKSNFEL